MAHRGKFSQRGPVGSDSMGDHLLAELEQCGVDTEYSFRADAASPRTLILLDEAGERTIIAVDSGTGPVSRRWDLLRPERPDAAQAAPGSWRAARPPGHSCGDLGAEVARLERLGAERVHQMQAWWVMRDPAGVLFCVLPVSPGSLNEENAQRWE
jgi:hypothetical protein